jgi:hypothetical protein
MIIAVEIEIEIREGLTGELITLLQEHACEVRRLALTEKKNRSGIYTVNFVYSDEKLFRRLTERLQSGENFKLLGIINYLDRKLSEGVLEVRGRLELENTEDFEMNVRGAAMRLDEKIRQSKTPALETG